MATQLLQITSGRGPAECCWVVAQVLKFLLDEARAKGLETTVVAREKGIENGTLWSALVQLEGKTAAEFAASWTGTVQWVGQSTFRKYHKRKNWFVGIDKVEMSESAGFKEKDIHYQAFRAGGPGGQHVNKVSTAIRALHQPSGLMVVASDSRSQAQNKKLARLRLMGLLQQREMELKHKHFQDSWQQHNELERGNPVRIFTGSDFKRKTIKNKTKANRQQSKADMNKRHWDDES